MKTFLLIDGENFKGYIKEVLESERMKRPLWYEYDFGKLLERALEGREVERAIFYFARLSEHPQTLKKSKELIEEQRLLKNHLEKQGFEVVMAGRVRAQVETKNFKKETLVFKEKGVDVRIAVDMVKWACDGDAQRIILGSSDSDLQPAVAEVRRRGADCIYLGFESNPNKGLTYTTGHTILIRNTEILEAHKSGKLFA